jgi:two-component system NarL family response regulator
VFEAARQAGATLSFDEAVTEVGELSVPNAVTGAVARTAAAGAQLSPREREVLQLLVAGQSDRQIAEALFISHRTAQGHVGNIFNKLGVSSRTAAATTAIRLGLARDTGEST